MKTRRRKRRESDWNIYYICVSRFFTIPVDAYYTCVSRFHTIPVDANVSIELKPVVDPTQTQDPAVPALELPIALKGFDTRKEDMVKKVAISSRDPGPSETTVEYSVVVPTQL